MFNAQPVVKLVCPTPHPLEVVKWAADVSRIDVGPDPVEYCKRFSREELVQYFKEMTRETFGTPLEYAQTVWYLDNVSRAAQQQLTRHRLASYSIQSMRVVDKRGFATKGLYHIPPNVGSNSEFLAKFEKAMTDIEVLYEMLLDLGMSEEDARGVLPMNIYSTITCAMNLRSLLHLITSRTCHKAQGEFKIIAQMMMDELRPWLGDDVVSLIDKPCKMHGKCNMRMENIQAIAGTTTRPLCPFFDKEKFA